MKDQFVCKVSGMRHTHSGIPLKEVNIRKHHGKQSLNDRNDM